MNTIQKLIKDGAKFSPPSWLGPNVHYETLMGSVAYGVSLDSSDVDLYGFCVPPKELVFPHLAGEIEGFGTQKKKFEQYQEHHIQCWNKSFDVAIYNIVKYFHLCMENNPNMIDSLFTPANCLKTCTPLAQRVRESRRIFLHKGSWHKFKGYAYSQMHKMDNKEKTVEDVRKFEDRNELSHSADFNQICEEINRRGLNNESKANSLS